MATSSAGLSSETNVSPLQYLGAGIALIVVTSFGVALRFIPSRDLRKVHVDDYVSVLALVFLTVTLALIYRLVGLLSDPKTTIPELLQWSQVTNWFTTLSLWSSKAPILFLYIRLFGVKRWVKLLCSSTLVLISLVDIAGGVSVSAVCDLRGRTLTPQHILNCSNASSIASVALGIVSVITDSLIFVVPLPIIYRLKMNMRKKISFMFVFATGIIAIALSALAVSFRYRNLHGYSFGLTDASLSFLAECSIAIAVSCTPAIHNCWVKFVVTSTLYSRLSSAFSKQLLRGTEHSDSIRLKGLNVTQVPYKSRANKVSNEAGSVTLYWVDESMGSDLRQ
ncbi:hypothetical protein GGR55DRAFT_648820 [Xylaria sp. FL0064]|nr:hypothetical protein GGR55DRAFT_648820 [Xylaria sp. FL0064]